MEKCVKNVFIIKINLKGDMTMNTFKIYTRDYKFIVIAEDKHSAQIKFSQHYPSLKIRIISQVYDSIFEINEED